MIVEKGLYFDRSAFQRAYIAKCEGIQLSREVCLGLTEASKTWPDFASSLTDPAFNPLVCQFFG